VAASIDARDAREVAETLTARLASIENAAAQQR